MKGKFPNNELPSDKRIHAFTEVNIETQFEFKRFDYYINYYIL